MISFALHLSWVTGVSANHEYPMLTSNTYGVEHCNVVVGVGCVTTVRTSRCPPAFTGIVCLAAQCGVLLWRTAFGSPNSIYFSNPKNGHQTNRTVHVTSSCACCGFLRSRLKSQSWNSFNPFPIVNRVSAGVPTPPDSGKTPQLKTSKLAQNCGKIEVLHLQPSYGICWSHEIETLPPM